MRKTVKLDSANKAALIWRVLVSAAMKRRPLTYESVGKLTGIWHRNLGEPLGLIDEYCQGKRFPRLNVLVVLSKRNVPGDGFPSPKLNRNQVDAEQEKVFDFNWRATNGNPSPEDFPVHT